ncbi:MAG: hypothetical protein OHK0032_13320 [Thermodesulfovibrionales bacterium]
MVTEKGELLQALIEAYMMEKGTNDFYMQASVKAINEEAKRAFRTLAEWEQRHMEYIQFLYQSIQGDRDMLSFEAFKNRVSAPDVEGGIPVKDLEAGLERYSFIDDIGALTLALETEGRAYNLYRRLSETVDDSNVRVFMREMMGQERGHINYLKDMRLRLAETS